MSMEDVKQVKKELKGLKKEAKKKKNPWAVLAAFFLCFLIKDEKEREDVRKNASKVEGAEVIEKAVYRYMVEKDGSALASLEGELGELFTLIFNGEFNERLKELFSKLPSVYLKAELAKLFVGTLLEKGEADTALFFLNQIGKVKDPYVWFLMGWAYELKGIVNMARDFLEKAAKAGEDKAKERLAAIYIKQGDPAKAASIYEELGRLDEAVRCYVDAGKLKDAKKLLEEVADSKLKVDVASALVKAGRFDDALELVEGLDSPEARLIKALCIENEKPDEALELARSSFKQLSGQLKKWALALMARRLKDKGKWSEIVSLLYPYEATGDLDTKERLILAHALYTTGDEPRALKLLALLMDTEARREAKALVKEIKRSTEDPEIEEICANILAEDSFFKRLKEGLKKSKDSIIGRLEALIEDKKQIKELSIEEVEEILLSADMGVEATEEIVGALKRRIEIGEIKSGQGLMHALEEEILRILKKAEAPLILDAKPAVIMVVGVNGTGKTTTIGKLGHMLKKRGYSVLFAAGDTFRAAAIEQLEIWGQRAGIPVIKQKPGADPSGVVYDAIKSAKARNIDVVIIDTAGRLHTKVNLMEELKKMARIASREVPGAPHETLLVLDAVVGQNAISQAKLFSEAVPVTGIVLTKLDGTAKGGIVVAIAKKFGIPIKFIGVGEGIDDLQEFNAERFVDALFDR